MRWTLTLFFNFEVTKYIGDSVDISTIDRFFSIVIHLSASLQHLKINYRIASYQSVPVAAREWSVVLYLMTLLQRRLFTSLCMTYANSAWTKREMKANTGPKKVMKWAIPRNLCIRMKVQHSVTEFHHNLSMFFGSAKFRCTSDMKLFLCFSLFYEKCVAPCILWPLKKLYYSNWRCNIFCYLILEIYDLLVD